MAKKKKAKKTKKARDALDAYFRTADGMLRNVIYPRGGGEYSDPSSPQERKEIDALKKQAEEGWKDLIEFFDKEIRDRAARQGSSRIPRFNLLIPRSLLRGYPLSVFARTPTTPARLWREAIQSGSKLDCFAPSGRSQRRIRDTALLVARRFIDDRRLRVFGTPTIGAGVWCCKTESSQSVQRWPRQLFGTISEIHFRT